MEEKVKNYIALVTYIEQMAPLLTVQNSWLHVGGQSIMT